MVTRTIIILAILVLLPSCKSSKLVTNANIDDLTSLRLDGCYYEAVPSKYHYSSVYVFYSNGVLLNLNNIPLLKLQDRLIESITSEFHLNITRRVGDATNWGAVNIQKGDIVFEIWTPSSGGGLRTIISKGKILNDTTFVINEFINNYENGKKHIANDIFHFKQFSPKPDSTNQFVK